MEIIQNKKQAVIPDSRPRETRASARRGFMEMNKFGGQPDIVHGARKSHM